MFLKRMSKLHGAREALEQIWVSERKITEHLVEGLLDRNISF